MKIRFVMFQVSICGDEHIPVYIITFLTNFIFSPPPHATDSVPPVPDCFTRAVKIVWAEPFFSNVCEKKQAQLIQMGSRRARTRTVGLRALSDPSLGTHFCTETAPGGPREVISESLICRLQFVNQCIYNGSTMGFPPILISLPGVHP